MTPPSTSGSGHVEEDSGDDTQRVMVFVRGDVQGVGFRWWTRARALELGLTGHARNLRDGRVEVVAQGGSGAIRRFVSLLEEQPSHTGRPGTVAGVVTQDAAVRADLQGFVER